MKHNADTFDHAPRVLIVDDDAHNCQLLRDMLNPEGYDLRFASSGEEALASVTEHPPDIILLDVMMPGTDGYEVAATIKRAPLTKPIPIILVTALDDHDSKMKGLTAGAEDFLSKPVDRAELLLRVRNLLRLKAYGDYYDNYSRELEGEVLLRTSEVRHERDRAQRYLDTATVILLALDPSGRITLVNRFACSCLGWEEGELLGQDWISTCISASMRPHVRARLDRLLEGGRSITENTILTRTGEERQIEWHSTVVRNDQDAVIGTFSSGIDITDRNRAITALQITEERMRFALEAASIGIWDIDVATGRIQVSPILESQYGLPAGSFDGTLDGLMRCIHPEDRSRMTKEMAEADQAGKDFSLRYRTLWPNGMTRWLEGAGRIMQDENGVPVRGIGILQDITERRGLERRVQQAQRLEAIGRLAGGVAHDFNNLLTVILGTTELVKADPSLTDAHREDLEEVLKASRSAVALTKQLLAVGRQQVLLPVRLDVNRLLLAMQGTLERLCGRPINLTITLAPNLPLTLADRSQIEQVVLNLVVNARDAMTVGGSIVIETSIVELPATLIRYEAVPPGRYIMLSIADTGIGMSAELQRNIFEPFFTTRAAGEGTGLGLSTTDGIVRQSHGFIAVESSVGKGTTFRVYLPCPSFDETVPGPPEAAVTPE